MLFPRPLRAGDTIAVVAPAGAFNTALLSPALATLEQAGLRTRVMPHVCGRYGSFSGTLQERLSDFTEAWTDPEVRALLCARGGFGAVHLLEDIAALDLRTDPKWLVGFSDISAIHALMLSRGIASMHASMLKCLQSADDPYGQMLISALKGHLRDYHVASHRHNRQGMASGTLFGGNLAVLDDLASTPFDMLSRPGILMIEDINEPIYRLERIMWRLRLSGVFDRLSGLIVGQWVDCKADANYACADDMISRMLSDYSFPIIFNAPIGHVDFNVPMVLGAETTIRVSDTSAIISQSLEFF